MDSSSFTARTPSVRPMLVRADLWGRQRARLPDERGAVAARGRGPNAIAPSVTQGLTIGESGVGGFPALVNIDLNTFSVRVSNDVGSSPLLESDKRAAVAGTGMSLTDSSWTSVSGMNRTHGEPFDAKRRLRRSGAMPRGGTCVASWPHGTVFLLPVTVYDASDVMRTLGSQCARDRPESRFGSSPCRPGRALGQTYASTNVLTRFILRCPSPANQGHSPEKSDCHSEPRAPGNLLPIRSPNAPAAWRIAQIPSHLLGREDSNL
jgi:hypothetical protein